MKIALINIRCDFTAYEPRGIMQIAAVLKESGHKVVLIDPLYSEIDYEKIAQFQPDIIGISFMSVNYYSAKKVAEKIKSTFPRTTLIAGGVHPTVAPESALTELGFDYVVIGEGERTIIELINHLRDKKPLSELQLIKGIAFLDEKQNMHITEERPFINDLDSIPFPAREEIEMNNYLLPPGYIRSSVLNRVGIIYSSRGCPGQCTFCCSLAMCKGKYRQRSVKNVIKEIDLLLNDYNIDGIYFSDETFSYDRNWVIDLCGEIKKYKLPWGLETRISLVDSELLEIMKSAGCVQIDYGVESGSDAILKSLKKGCNRKMIEKTFELTHKAGIKSFATVMVGVPDETTDDINQTINLLKNIKPDFTLCAFFVPFPGTEAYAKLVAQKRIEKDFYKNRDYHFIVADKPLINVSAMSDKELLQAKARINQATVVRNYLSAITLKNISFYLKIIFYSAINPFALFKSIFIALRSGRFDRFAGFLLKNYQAKIRNVKYSS